MFTRLPCEFLYGNWISSPEPLTEQLKAVFADMCRVARNLVADSDSLPDKVFVRTRGVWGRKDGGAEEGRETTPGPPRVSLTVDVVVAGDAWDVAWVIDSPELEV